MMLDEEEELDLEQIMMLNDEEAETPKNN